MCLQAYQIWRDVATAIGIAFDVVNIERDFLYIVNRTIVLLTMYKKRFTLASHP